MSFIFLIFITAVLVIHIASSDKVDTNVIIGSICGYLLIGLIGALLLSMGEIFNKHSFTSNGNLVENSFDSVYFSFETLTTLGYGDIIPHSKFAKVSSMLISISGQLYLAVLIAMLVGKFIYHSNKKGNE
jgi:voltage-gated potassium channel Kch